MKIRLYLKDPDGFSESVDDAVKEDVAKLGLPEDEAEALLELRHEKAWDLLKKWVKHREYIGILIDTDTMTAVVEETD